MKKAIIVIILIIFLTLFATLIIGILTKSHSNKIRMEKIKSFPLFSLSTLEDSIFFSGKIKEGPVLVMFFHPECEHCQYQITSLLNKKNEIAGTRIILISNAGKKLLRDFLKSYDVEEFPKLVTLVDEGLNFKKYFGTDMVPSLFVYDRKLKLVRHFQGEVKPETLLKYLMRDE